MSQKETENLRIDPIGYVRRNNGRTYLEVKEPYKPALKQLGHFSHVQVVWWFNIFEDEESRKTLRNKPPYEDAPETGVFASRSPVRPNPIALTTAPITKVDEENGTVEVSGIDAFDDSPVLDLKAYFPVCDRIKDFSVPPWVAHWPEWMPEEGLNPEGG